MFDYEVEHTAHKTLEYSKERVDTLVELLGIKVLRVRASSYAGLELVLSWNPDYRAITVIMTTSGLWLTSKHEFPFSEFGQIDLWELTI